eukprot:752801-Hanusia_phi.AAC.2
MSNQEMFLLRALAYGDCEFKMSCWERDHFFGSALAERFNEIRPETCQIRFKRRYIYHIIGEYIETYFVGEEIVLHPFRDEILVPELPLRMITSQWSNEGSLALAQQERIFNLFQLYVYFTSHKTILLTHVALTEGRWSDPVFHFAAKTQQHEFRDLEKNLLETIDARYLDMLSRCDGPLHFKRQMGSLIDMLITSGATKNERNFRQDATIA